jgi:hypothetical protein
MSEQNKIIPAESLDQKKIPLEKLVQVQVLCDRGESDEAIAALSELSISLVQGLIEQNGWRDDPLLDRSEAHDYVASRRVLIKRWERAVGANARWLSMQGFQMISNAETPRDFKDAAQGTKLMVELAREAEGMDRKDEPKGLGSGINLFYIEAPLGRAEKIVGPAGPVEKVEPIQVEVIPASGGVEEL